MWIIPSNHPLYSAFAQGCVASKEELSELSENLESSLMWRSKPSSLKTWCSRWNKVYWLPHLFSRMLKPSRSKSFEDAYTESLVVIPVSRSPQRDSGRERTTHDTFGRLLSVALKNRGLAGSFSRMSRDTYRLVSSVYIRTYGKWVMLLRRESLQRRKSEPLTAEQGSLFSGWKTPSSSECEGGIMNKGKIGNAKYKLRDQVSWPTPDTFDKGEANVNQKSNKKNVPKNFNEALNWQTPVSSRGEYQNQKNGSKKNKLMGQVLEKAWPTPRTVMYRDSHTDRGKHNLGEVVNSWPTPTVAEAGKISNAANYGQVGLSNHPTIVGEPERQKLNKSIAGQPDQTRSNTIGRKPVLNPAWVMQLMGTTLEKTFFAWREMQLSNKRQNSPL